VILLRLNVLVAYSPRSRYEILAIIGHAETTVEVPQPNAQTLSVLPEAFSFCFDRGKVMSEKNTTSLRGVSPRLYGPMAEQL
jgi:hypothetical protein